MVATLPAESFELAGPVWPNATCMAIYLVFFLPMSLVLIAFARRKHRLWRRATKRRYDHRALGRAAARLGLRAEFVKEGRYDRFLNRRYGVGYFEAALGLIVLALTIMVLLWLPFGDPARLHVTPSLLVLDYRWPRPDQEVDIKHVTQVTYLQSRVKRGYRYRLQLKLPANELLPIEPPGYRGNIDQLRAAGECIARYANVPFDEIVQPRRK